MSKATPEKDDPAALSSDQLRGTLAKCGSAAVSPQKESSEQIEIVFTVTREQIEHAAPMAARFGIDLETFIRFHADEGMVTHLNMASTDIEWTPFSYPFPNRAAAINAARVVCEKLTYHAATDVIYMRGGKEHLEKLTSEDLGHDFIASRAAQREKEMEASHM